MAALVDEQAELIGIDALPPGTELAAEQELDLVLQLLDPPLRVPDRVRLLADDHRLPRGGAGQEIGVDLSLQPDLDDAALALRLTDLATVAAAYALWSQRHWAFALTYYWGLVLSAQALISPVLIGPDFPHYTFLAFWAIHLLVVWAAIYLTWGRGMRPTWRSYRIVVMVTVVWAAVTFAFNSIAGTNYGFLNGKPATATLLDVLGPWPLYVLTAAMLILIVWALMTWPWERTRRRLKGDPQSA